MSAPSAIRRAAIIKLQAVGCNAAKSDSSALYNYRFVLVCLQLKYDFLVIAMGIELNYDQVTHNIHTRIRAGARAL